MLDQKISDLSVGSLGASDYTIIQRGTNNYRFLIRDAIDARIYSLAALSGHGHTIATSSVSGFMSAADKIKLDSIASGATSSGASGDAYAVSHESDTTAHTAANIVNVPAGNISAITVQAALNELDTEKQPLDALLTALSALTTTADKFIYFTGSDTPATSTVTAFARTFLDDTSGSGVLATLSGISREELSYGGVGVADYNKIPKYNIDGSLAVSNKISIFNPDDTRFVNVKYLSNIGDYNLFIPGTVAEDDAYFVVVPATAQVGDIVYWGGTGVGGIATNGTSGYVLISNGAGSPPTWGQVTGGGGSGVSDGDKGDITVSSAGAVWTIDSGLNASKIANGTISNTEFQYLSGATSNIQTQLENKQPLNVILTALSALTTAADRFIYFTGVNTPVTGEITAFARSILDDVNGNSVLATISGISNEQLSIGGFGASDSGKIPIFTGDGSLNISNTLYIHNGSGSASITYPFPNIHDLVIPNTVSSNSSSLMTLDSVESRYGDLVYWGGVNTGCVSTIGPSGHVLKSNGTGNAPTWEPVTGWYANIYSVDVLDATSEYYSASDEQKVVKFGSSGSLAIYSDLPDSSLFIIENFGCSSPSTANIYSSTDLTGSVSIHGTSRFGYGLYGAARSVYGTAIKAVGISTGVAIELSNNSFSTKLSTLATSDHFVQFPDKSGVVAMLSDITGGGVSDGDKGDITVSSAGSMWTINSGLSAAKIANGSVSDAEFQYLDGVTSNIQSQLGGKQSLDATLTALAAYNTNGIVTQTAPDTFTGRVITGTSNEITVTNGDGVAGNPTLSLSTGIDPAKLANGSISATEFQYLDGVTSNIQTQFSNKQSLDATLTALAAYNTNGLLVQTTTDNFVGRAVTAGQGISISNGDGVAGNPTVALNTNALRGEISFRIDGGGSAITTGAKKFYLRVGYDCTITGWELVADQSGSISIDIWKDSFANFPPTVADTITASAKPSLSTAQKNSSSSLTGWTTSLSAGDYLEVNVDSVSTVTLAILTLLVTRT